MHIESWERDIRSFEKQTSFEIPDFVNAGILINGLQEEPLRKHMVLYTSRLDTYEKLRLEVTEIARAKIMAVNSVPMEVDSLRFKGKGKRKSKDHNYYCGKKGHKKSECLRRKSDLEKAKSEGRPAVPPQSVHTIHEVGHSSSSSTVDDARSLRGTAGISVVRTTLGTQRCDSGYKVPHERHHVGFLCCSERLPCGLLPGVWHPARPAH